MAAKPASPALQTGHSLYTNMVMAHLFQGGVAEDLFNNFDWTVTDPGSDDISFTTPGNDDDPWVDRDSTANTDRLTSAGGPQIGFANFSVAMRIYCRGTASYGMLAGENATTGLYTIPSGSGFKLRYYTGATPHDSTTELSFNTAYSIGFTYTHSGTSGTFYVDGVADGTTSANIGTHNYTASLSDTFSERFDGRIAFQYVWDDRALTGTDFSNLHTDPYEVVRATGGGGPGKGGGGQGSGGGKGGVGGPGGGPGGGAHNIGRRQFYTF